MLDRLTSLKAACDVLHAKGKKNPLHATAIRDARVAAEELGKELTGFVWGGCLPRFRAASGGVVSCAGQTAACAHELVVAVAGAVQRTFVVAVAGAVQRTFVVDKLSGWAESWTAERHPVLAELKKEDLDRLRAGVELEHGKLVAGVSSVAAPWQSSPRRESVLIADFSWLDHVSGDLRPLHAAAEELYDEVCDYCGEEPESCGVEPEPKLEPITEGEHPLWKAVVAVQRELAKLGLRERLPAENQNLGTP